MYQFTSRANGLAAQIFRILPRNPFFLKKLLVDEILHEAVQGRALQMIENGVFRKKFLINPLNRHKRESQTHQSWYCTCRNNRTGYNQLPMVLSQTSENGHRSPWGCSHTLRGNHEH
jgi:hypothetical protein